MSKLSLLSTVAALAFSCSAAAEIHTDVTDGLLFRYDPNPGILAGLEGTKDSLLGTIDAFDYSNATFSFWINIDDVSPGWTSVFHVGNEPMERYPGVWLYDNDTTVHYRIGTDGYSNSAAESSVPLPLDTWVKVTSVWDDGIGSLYYNDTKMVTYTNYTFDFLDDLVGNETWSVYASDPWHEPFNGYIDDVRIYDRALTPQELDDTYYSSRYLDVTTPFSAFALLALPFACWRYRRRTPS